MREMGKGDELECGDAVANSDEGGASDGWVND
jgi:hypothetical protein